MCYVGHNHGTAIEMHSQLFPLQPNDAELGALSAISVTAECCRTRRNVTLVCGCTRCSSIYKTLSHQKCVINVEEFTIYVHLEREYSSISRKNTF